MIQKLIILVLVFHFPSLYGQWINTGAFNKGMISCFASNDSIIFAGAKNIRTDTSIFLSSDDGLSWQPASFSFSYSFPVSSLINKENVLFIGNEDFRGAFVSMDNCQTIQQRSEGMGETADGSWPSINSFALYGDTLFAGTYFISPAIYRTTNNGVNWTTVLYTTYSVNAMQISGKNIYAGTDGEFYYSSDNGNHWEQRNINVNNVSIYALAVNALYVFAGTNKGIYRSSDNGEHWQPFNNGLANIHVLSLLAHDSTIYLGTNGGGVYLSTDNGEQWTSVNAGLQDTSITSIYIYKRNILAGSSTGRIWVHSLSQSFTNVSPTRHVFPIKYSLQQNYPNPFNPTTTINYSIPKTILVTIKIYDMLGRKVSTLVGRKESPGNYSVIFNGIGLSSGIYFYQMKAGVYIQTRKMILLK